MYSYFNQIVHVLLKKIEQYTSSSGCQSKTKMGSNISITSYLLCAPLADSFNFSWDFVSLWNRDNNIYVAEVLGELY